MNQLTLTLRLDPGKKGQINKIALTITIMYCFERNETL